MQACFLERCSCWPAGEVPPVATGLPVVLTTLFTWGVVASVGIFLIKKGRRDKTLPTARSTWDESSSAVCACVCVRAWPCVHTCACACVRVCVCVRFSVCLSISVCLCLSVCVSRYLCASVSVCLCVAVSLSLCLCVCLGDCVCVCVSVPVCGCVSLAVSVCVSRCRCRSTGLQADPPSLSVTALLSST